MIEYRSLRVALLGGGTVGANVARRLIDHSDELAARVGAHIDLIGVAVLGLGLHVLRNINFDPLTLS